MHKPLNKLRSYRQFVNGRDKALEVLLRNSRLRNSERTADAFRRILEAVQMQYPNIQATGSRYAMDSLENHIKQLLEHLSFNLWVEMTDLRKKAYMLAYAGEVNAISGMTKKPPKISLSKTRLDELTTERLSNGLPAMQAFSLRMNKLRRKIISSIEYSLAFGEPVEKAMGRVFMDLPKTKYLAKKKVLKTVKVTEASGRRPKFIGEMDSVEITIGGKKGISFGFEWDQETWDNMITELASEHVFTDRSPEKFLDMKNPYNDLKIRDKIPEEDKIYAWEIEQETVHDFVERVRSGQVEAAKKNGFNEFVWIAVLDDRTDECCEWRSGLLTSEIEHRLKTDMVNDHCRAVVPPAHFNCRCTLAPASNDIEAVDNTDVDMEFDAWLRSDNQE